MAVPLALRDELYRRWRDGLPMPSAGDDPYLKDRLPRYRAVRKKGGPLEVAQSLLDNGLYFDAHEYLEGFWRKARGAEKTRLQGVIQLAAAFHKLELDPAAQSGALYLLEAALEKLPDEAIQTTLAPVVAALRSKSFRLSRLPPIRL